MLRFERIQDIIANWRAVWLMECTNVSLFVETKWMWIVSLLSSENWTQRDCVRFPRHGKVYIWFFCTKLDELGHSVSEAASVNYTTCASIKPICTVYVLKHQLICLWRFSCKSLNQCWLVVLVVLRLNVPVNNFSVMSGRSHRFLGN